MFENDSPIKQILFDKLVELGRLSPNPDISTIQTIKDISDSDATKLYNSITGGPSIQKNMGGLMDINDMTKPVGYAPGGEVDDFPFGKPGDPGYSTGTDPTVDPLKDTKRLASARTSTTKPWDVYLKDAGYTKNADIDDVKRFAKDGRKIKVGQVIGSNSAFRRVLDALNVKQGTPEATNVLNQALKKAGKPMYVAGAKAAEEIGEDLISAVTKTEFGHPNTKTVRDEAAKKIKDLKTKANKLHGANPSKAKNAFFKEALERMWPVLKNTTRGAAVLSATIAKGALGKALGPLDLLIDASPSPRGTGELTPEIIEEFKKGQAQERMNKRGGGMMNMNEMTRPLGYAAGGPIPQEPEQTGMISGLMSLIKNIRENAFAPEQREDGGEEYMKIFNFLWKQGYDSQQIDDIINRRVNQEDLVPSHDGSEEFKG